jgi:release factor glutamine methyltransferase
MTETETPVRDDSPLRLLDAIQRATDYVTAHAVPHGRLACELLAAHVLQCRRLELYLRFDQRLTDAQRLGLRAGLRRLAAGEPIQYVVGDTEFMGWRLKVDRRALIPRPDTETLVEAVLGCETLWQARAPVIVDVGTGTGCVAISLARARPHAVCLAVDTSAEALALARENIAQHALGGRVDLRQADLLEGMATDSADAVVANLPYVPSGEWERLMPLVRDCEPRVALDGGEDGLTIVGRLIDQAGQVLKPGGLLALEMGFDQGARVATRLKDRGFVDVRTVQDIERRDRVALACRPRTN